MDLHTLHAQIVAGMYASGLFKQSELQALMREAGIHCTSDGHTYKLAHGIRMPTLDEWNAIVHHWGVEGVAVGAARAGGLSLVTADTTADHVSLMVQAAGVSRASASLVEASAHAMSPDSDGGAEVTAEERARLAAEAERVASQAGQLAGALRARGPEGNRPGRGE